MKKNVIDALSSEAASGQPWLDVESLADVEVTSEDPDYPIETVFSSAGGPGWRAAKPGKQTVRLLFKEPQTIRQIHLEFSEAEMNRQQEFTLGWAGASDSRLKEIVRQQWNFSPQGSTSEVEDFQVNLSGVAALELTVIPDVSGGGLASLARWRVA